MPYIQKQYRVQPDVWLDKIVDNIRALHPDNRDGVLNYCVSYLIAESMRPQEGWCYWVASRAHSVFIMAAAEFYRRVVAPYEDKCIKKNGDIKSYENP